MFRKVLNVAKKICKALVEKSENRLKTWKIIKGQDVKKRPFVMN